MRSATVSPASKFSLAMAFAIALSVVGLASNAAAQDATKVDSASPATKQADRQQRRAERRQAEATAKAESGAKTEALAKFPKADSTEAANAAPAKPKMECRTQEVTGSRMGKRICATPEQWAEADAAGEEAARQMKSQANTRAGAAIDLGPFHSGSTL